MRRTNERQRDMSPDPSSKVWAADGASRAPPWDADDQLPCQPARDDATIERRVPEDPPPVTVIVPCRNERAYVMRALDSIRATAYPTRRIEILVIDGMSDDGTAELVERYARRHPGVRLLRNRRRTVPHGLNLGIRHARGDVIVRMDAHVEYPRDYIPRLVRWLLATGAENVGAACVTRPGAATPMARAIAFASSHPLGVGGSRFRIGTRRLLEVDTVPFGCFPRRVFERFGAFDEELARNQDDEFNHRIRAGGGRVLLVPDVVCYYYARRTLRQAARMFYQYGLFKPLAARKVGRVSTLRQLVPPAALGGGLALALGALWSDAARIALLAGAGAYGALVAAVAASAARRAGAAAGLRLPAVLATMHASYGLGYWVGLARLLRRHRAAGAAEPPISR